MRKILTGVLATIATALILGSTAAQAAPPAPLPPFGQGTHEARIVGPICYTDITTVTATDRVTITTEVHCAGLPVCTTTRTIHPTGNWSETPRVCTSLRLQARDRMSLRSMPTGPTPHGWYGVQR